MSCFKKLFSKKIPIIGMIHVSALPGTAFYNGSFKLIIQKASQEAQLYKEFKMDGIIVENMNDIPYVKANKLGPEIVSSMTRICIEIKRIVPEIPHGVQILAGGNKEAIAVAKASDFQFIRSEGYIFGHVADEGYMDACAGSLLRYRNNIDANHILVLADIKKKHSSHAITSDINIIDTAKAAEFFRADGLIITGKSTGDPPANTEMQIVQKATNLPVIIGSGVNQNNLKNYQTADAVIVGSEFKFNGKWENDLCVQRIQKFMDTVKKLRKI